MRMSRSLIFFCSGALLGLAAGFALAIFVYPYVFPDDIVASEAAPDVARQVVARGSFIHANPSDPIHYRSGGVTIYGDVLRLEEDFKVGPGPKFHVYLVPEGKVTPDTPVSRTAFVDLGRLRAFRGSQNYSLPPGLDITLRQRGRLVRAVRRADLARHIGEGGSSLAVFGGRVRQQGGGRRGWLALAQFLAQRRIVEFQRLHGLPQHDQIVLGLRHLGQHFGHLASGRLFEPRRQQLAQPALGSLETAVGTTEAVVVHGLPWQSRMATSATHLTEAIPGLQGGNTVPGGEMRQSAEG